MSKTPFEVRLDVLKMAQDMLDRETQLAQVAFSAEVNNLETTNISAVSNFIQTARPRGYTTEELLSRSKELYSFVTDKTIK